MTLSNQLEPLKLDKDAETSAEAASVSLLALPQDVTDRILEFLLLASERKCDPAIAPAPDRFHVQILQTCKRFHVQGSSILYRNNYILVVANFDDIVTALNEAGVDIFPRDIRLSPSCQLCIEVTSRQDRLNLNYYDATILLLLGDAQQSVYALRMLACCKEARLHFGFEMRPAGVGGDMISMKRQKALLTPFDELRSLNDGCNIGGCVYTVLAKTVEARITPSVHWLLGYHRDFFEIATWRGRTLQLPHIDSAT